MSDNIVNAIHAPLGDPILALETHMGRGPAYVASVPLNWVAEHVEFAGRIPFFRDFVNAATRKITVNEVTVEQILQRHPDWRRQLPMSAYLAAWENRKFPTLMAVGYQDWAHEPQAGEWGDDGKATRATVAAVNTSIRGVHELRVTDMQFYALDGQHRLMALKGLRKLILDGKLPVWDRSGEKEMGEAGLSLQDIAQSVKRQGGPDMDEKAIRAMLVEILNDGKIGMEIIPAVIQGESQEEAKFRLRGVFVDVNENARLPTRGESILLDEKNGFRVVARQLMVSHKLLKGRVEMQGNKLTKATPCYTTLEALAQTATAYLGSGEFSEWKIPLVPSIRASGHVRPKGGEKEIQRGATALCGYFDQMATLPSHGKVIRGESSASEFRKKGGENNILFRPVGQVALAEAVSELVHKHQVTLASIFQKLRNQETCKQLNLHNPDAPWRGVVWDFAKDKVLMAKPLCRRLFVYLLGGKLSERKLARLRDDFTIARKKHGEKNLHLPAPWR